MTIGGNVLGKGFDDRGDDVNARRIQRLFNLRNNLTEVIEKLLISMVFHRSVLASATATEENGRQVLIALAFGDEAVETVAPLMEQAGALLVVADDNEGDSEDA